MNKTTVSVFAATTNQVPAQAAASNPMLANTGRRVERR